MSVSRAAHASSAQADLFRGLRFWVDPQGRTRLEGTVMNASKYTGLAERTIHHYIEEGEIESRQPGANRADAKKLDAIGRERRFKHLVNMRDVFRIAYGELKAREMMAQMGLSYD